ncbi:DUF6230 family protein [Actinoplanes sp. CA-142083]|uniref:DUF6230 family protein n=1 Tax=Actinoplanes sp. CA-142083 TaxID=3239903 RepID=UPI003D8CD462
MVDSQGDAMEGRTNWRRFGVAVGLPIVAAGVLVAGVASGAVAASFSISGTQFKLSADRLEGTGFTQYSSILKTVDANGNEVPTTPAAMSGINHAEIYNLCQTVAVGPVVLRIEAGKNNNPVVADNLLIGMSELSGDATFTDINIGTDASKLNKDGFDTHGARGGFGQEAEHVTIEGLHQVAYSTTAHTFKLTGMSLKLHVGDGKECF